MIIILSALIAIASFVPVSSEAVIAMFRGKFSDSVPSRIGRKYQLVYKDNAVNVPLDAIREHNTRPDGKMSDGTNGTFYNVRMVAG